MKKSFDKIIEEIISYCESNDVYWFCELVQNSKDKKDWFHVLTSDKGTFLIANHLASKALSAGKITEEQYKELTVDFIDSEE